MSIRIDGTNTTANPGITGSDTDTGLQFGTNEVKVVTDGTTRATVDSSGRVGIATTPEAWSGFDALEVNEASIVSSGSGDAFFTANAYYDGAWKYKDDGVARNIYMNADGIVFRTAAAGSADGAISWTEVGRWREGGGLTFGGDTAAINALDDYEEGSWTPNINSGGWSGVGTINSAKYIKIGALVFVQCFVGALTGTGNGDVLKLGSLPFNSIGQGYAAGSVDFGAGSVKGAYCRVESNSNLISFFYPSENNSTSRITLKGNQIGDDYIILGLTYFTNA